MNRDVRAALLASLATIMTMLALGPLLADRAWLQPVVLVVAAVGLSGAAVAAAELARWWSPLLTSTAALVIATALLVPAQATLGGFVPTPTSLDALVVLVRSGLATTQAVLPPAPVEAGVTALLTLAAGAVAVLTLLIAGPFRRPGAAGLPLLLVVCIASALAPDGIGVLGYLSAALGYLALALTDGDRRVRSWGAVLARRTRSGERAPSGVTERLAQAAATTAVLALVAGGALPVLTPGGGDRLRELVTDRFGDGGGAADVRTVNPFLDIREDLDSRSDTVVIRYSTTDPDPDPLRIVTADSFDGSVWVPADTSLPGDQNVSGGLPAPPGASTDVLSAATQVNTSIGVGALAQTYLPLPYPAASVDVPGRWLYDERTLNVLSTDGTTEGISYDVTSYDIRPDPALLDAVPADGLDPVWTELPGDVREVVSAEALRVVAEADAGTRYEQALALQQWFRNSGGFSYSLDAPETTDSDAVQAFLTERTGYCVQFASTMALMARSLEIPARVAVGFLPGQEVDPGQWEIRVDDAHAWPELYFEGVGWVRFEPTPAARTGTPPQWAVPPADPAAPQPTQDADQAVPTPEAPDPEAPDPGDRAGTDDGRADRVLGVVAVALQVLGVLGLAVALLALPRASRWWRDRRRVAAAAADDASLAVVWWTVLLERLADLDALPAGWTVREQAASLTAAESLGRPEQDALARLAMANEQALYAATPTPADAAGEDVRKVLAAVAQQRDPRRRRRATWFPTPRPDVVPRLATAPGRTAERVG